MYHYQKPGTFPVKITMEISSDQKLEQEAKERHDAYFNNQEVKEDFSDYVRIPFNKFEEFQRKYEQLLEEYQ